MSDSEVILFIILDSLSYSDEIFLNLELIEFELELKNFIENNYYYLWFSMREGIIEKYRHFKTISKKMSKYEECVKILNGAMKGLGTKEEVIIKELAKYRNQDLQQIKKTYLSCFGKVFLFFEKTFRYSIINYK